MGQRLQHILLRGGVASERMVLETLQGVGR